MLQSHKKSMVLLLALVMLFNSVGSALAAYEPTPSPATANEVRGVWFSYLDWRTYLQGKNQADFTAAFQTICDTSLREGVTDLFVHVRSHNDAVYPSAIYPWSTDMLTADQKSFDPLAIMVEIAHAKGLKFHAWINPYGYRQDAYSGDVSLVTQDNIINGITEILARYNVDGIHFDDYFPPLGADTHNQMIRRAYAAAHAYGKVFGISPQGNIENNINMGADIITWMSQPGYIDYICPQLYWTDQYGSNGTTTMYSDRLTRWQQLNTLDIPIYVGLAVYRAGTPSSSDRGWGWKNTNLAEQVTAARNNGYDGYLLYRYENLLESAPQTELTNLRNILPPKPIITTPVINETPVTPAPTVENPATTSDPIAQNEEVLPNGWVVVPLHTTVTTPAPQEKQEPAAAVNNNNPTTTLPPSVPVNNPSGFSQLDGYVGYDSTYGYYNYSNDPFNNTVVYLNSGYNL